MATSSSMHFRVKYIDLKKGEKEEKDYEYVVDALNEIERSGWSLNEKLYLLLIDGFLVTNDNTRMVMLLGVYAGGTEDLISNPLVRGQMGTPIPPFFNHNGGEVRPNGG